MTFGVVTNPKGFVRFTNVGSGFGLTKMIHSPAGGWLRVGGVRFIELKGLATTKSFFFGFMVLSSPRAVVWWSPESS